MKALLKEIDEHVEEQVTLIMEGVELVCFASLAPYKLKVGLSYPVAFQVFINDEYNLQKTSGTNSGVERLGNGFRYKLRGRLVGNSIQCGIPFEDEILESEFGYLQGELVELVVDRIDAEFF